MKLRDLFENSDDPFAEPANDIPSSDDEQIEFLDKKRNSALLLRDNFNDKARRIYSNFVPSRDFDHYEHDQFNHRVNGVWRGQYLTLYFDMNFHVREVFKKIEHYQKLSDHYSAQSVRLFDKINEIKRKQRKERAVAFKQENKPASTAQIPENQIPVTFKTGKSKIENPYFKNSEGRYAGDPLAYPFSTQSMNTFVELSNIIKENNVAGFTIMYASKHPYAHGGRTTYHLNYVLLAANGKFIWRKYDVGGASGQNMVYINGVKMATSTFLGMNKIKQAQMLKGL